MAIAMVTKWPNSAPDNLPPDDIRPGKAELPLEVKLSKSVQNLCRRIEAGAEAKEEEIPTAISNGRVTGSIKGVSAR